MKWGHPCYMHAGRNIAIIGAFRGDFRISFFNAALMKDPQGILEKQGPNTRHRDMMRFTDNSQVARMEPVILSYLKEAMGYAEAGTRPPKDPSDIELPGELVEALDSDSELTKAFYNLTPERQKSYVISIGSAKAATTRGCDRTLKSLHRRFAPRSAMRSPRYGDTSSVGFAGDSFDLNRALGDTPPGYYEPPRNPGVRACRIDGNSSGPSCSRGRR